MSTAKIQEPVYKVYEPGYHPHRTIILDEQVESPETLTIRLEEEAARNGGDLTRGCPPGLLPMPMSAYKSQPPQLHGYADSTYSQYSSQPFSSQQTENAASQINQMAFAANNAAAGQYLGASQVTPPNSVNVLSCHPSGGPQGTKVSLKATCQYDLVGSSVAASAPFVSLVFGSHRCAAKVARDSRDGSGACTYTITAAAPQFLSTGCPSLSNVPLTLLVESASGDELARVPNVGAFSYHDVQGGAAGGSAGFGVPDESSPPDLGSPKTRSPVHRPSPPSHDGQAQAKTTSQVAHPALTEEASTNTYGFSPSVSAPNTAAQIHAQPQTHPDFATAATGAYSQGSSSMLSSYRAASFTDHYTRAPPMLRSPHGTGWMFGSQLDPFRASTSALSHGTHAAVSRPSLTPLQHAGSPTPQLVRTSTLAQPAGGFPYGVYQEKATLKIIGDLSSMAEGWTQEEWENKRRLVLFRKQQTGSVLTVSFKPVSVAERPPHSICISCIWWEEKQACYVTSVDTIHLLEQLLAAPNRFGVDEKNRIRRNLEGFRPATVSKARAESEEFFKVIMGFGNPKPRNIEKDVKVFHWKDLSGALYKIISKYSASTTTVMTPNSSPHVATTVGLTGSYPALPPTPVSSTSSIAADTAASAGYAGAAGHHHADSLASPRTLSGGPSSWSTYDAAAAKTLSPGLKTNSPVGTSGLRLSAMPVVYDHRGSTHSLASPYGLSTPAHHNAHHTHAGYGHSGVPASQAQSRSWEGYSVAAADGYTSQAGSGHGQVYGGAAYEDGGPRA